MVHQVTQYGPLACAPRPSPTTLLAKLTHVLHGLAYFVTTYLFPALQPWLNALLFWLLARSLPKTQTQRGYEAQYMDCGYNREFPFDCAFRE